MCQRLSPAFSHHDDPACRRSRRSGEFTSNVLERGKGLMAGFDALGGHPDVETRRKR
jgi:hypothetical protein